MPGIIARSVELERLERLYQSERAEFLAVYGRHRVGKTFLISEYFRDKSLYFEVTGIKDADKASQLNKFHREFCRLFVMPADCLPPPDWDTALARLVEEVEKIPKNRKIILFFDELPWLATLRSNLVQELDYYWNRHFSRMNNVILIVCGSATAWMIKKIIQNKQGLYGRLSDEICLQPFTLCEVEMYLESRFIHYDRKQLAELFMVESSPKSASL